MKPTSGKSKNPLPHIVTAFMAITFVYIMCGLELLLILFTEKQLSMAMLIFCSLAYLMESYVVHLLNKYGVIFKDHAGE